MNKFSKWLRVKVFNWLGVESYVKQEINTAIEKIRQDLTIGFDYGCHKSRSSLWSGDVYSPRHTEEIKTVVEMILKHLQLELKYSDGTGAKVSLEPLTQIISISKEQAGEILKKRVNPETKKSKKG
jgi:hypothetical protein